jgi:PDZ domain-containing protein
MTRRSTASLLAAGLLVALLVVAALLPVPYVTVSPGRTIDVLGTSDGEPIVQVDGHRTYPDDGQLRLTTVAITRPEAQLSLTEALIGWLQRDVSVVPYEAMYPPDSTDREEETYSAAQMVSSQDTAVASALRQLGYRLPTHVEITGVDPDGPSDGVLEARDRMLEIDGDRTRTLRQLFRAMEDVEPGDRVSGAVRRQGERQTFTVVTEAAEDDPDRAVLGVLVGTGYRFPFDVRVGLGDDIGGPSAGLVFALSIYDVLTPGSLTDGQVIAGTGTITADGRVGPIGGVRQKVAGAQDAGARVFLVPPDNCAAAVLAPVDPERLRLVRADTLRSAIKSLEQYAEDPSADLPRCPA